MGTHRVNISQSPPKKMDSSHPPIALSISLEFYLWAIPRYVILPFLFIHTPWNPSEFGTQHAQKTIATIGNNNPTDPEFNFMGLIVGEKPHTGGMSWNTTQSTWMGLLWEIRDVCHIVKNDCNATMCTTTKVYILGLFAVCMYTSVGERTQFYALKQLISITTLDYNMQAITTPTMHHSMHKFYRGSST